MRTGILKALTLLTLLFLTGCEGIYSDLPSAARYEVRSTCADASVTYQAGQGSVQQSSVGATWEYQITNLDPGQFLYVSAQQRCESGTVTVSIYTRYAYGFDFELFKTASSNAAFGIATASGSY